jgi:hypothetical protein
MIGKAAETAAQQVNLALSGPLAAVEEAPSIVERTPDRAGRDSPAIVKPYFNQCSSSIKGVGRAVPAKA